MAAEELSPRARRRLLLLADEVAGWDAETGSTATRAALLGALEAVAHALVDLADGAAAAVARHGGTVAASRPRGRRTEEHVDPVSCSALAARLHHLAREVTATAPPVPLATTVTASCRLLAGALQRHAQDTTALVPAAAAPERTDGGRARASAHQRLLRAVRRAGDGLGRTAEPGGPPPATVSP